MKEKKLVNCYECANLSEHLVYEAPYGKISRDPKDFFTIPVSLFGKRIPVCFIKNSNFNEKQLR